MLIVQMIEKVLAAGIQPVGVVEQPQPGRGGTAQQLAGVVEGSGAQLARVLAET
jgi:hypothetical protein